MLSVSNFLFKIPLSFLLRFRPRTSSFLEDNKVDQKRAELFAKGFEAKKMEVRIMLSSTSVGFPHIVDVNWRLDYFIKVSLLFFRGFMLLGGENDWKFWMFSLTCTGKEAGQGGQARVHD